MKKIFCLVIAILMIGGSAMAERLIRPERLLELAGLTASAVDADRLEACIKHLSITEKSLEGATPSDISKELLEVLDTDFMSSFDYLWRSPETVKYDGGKEKPLSLSAYSWNETICESAYIDFQHGEICADTARWIFSDIQSATVQRSLDQTLEAAVLELLASGSPGKWPSPNASAGEGRGACGIAVETEKGITRWVVFEGAGGAPEPYFETLYGLLKLALGSVYDD